MPGGKKTYHCAVEGFFEFSPMNNMLITYETPKTQHAEVFQCHVHAEKKKPDCDSCSGQNKYENTQGKAVIVSQKEKKLDESFFFSY